MDEPKRRERTDFLPGAAETRSFLNPHIDNNSLVSQQSKFINEVKLSPPTSETHKPDQNRKLSAGMERKPLAGGALAASRQMEPKRTGEFASLGSTVFVSLATLDPRDSGCS